MPNNLTVVTDSPVAKVLFEGKKAIGVTTLASQTFYASKEIILSAGSLDTPRILMHSGIGPSSQLQEYDIPVLHDNPAIGQHLKDHYHVGVSYQRAPHKSTRPAYYSSTPEFKVAARKQWETSRTGPLTEIGVCLGMGFPKNTAILQSPEFKALPSSTQAYLNLPTVPSAEYIVGSPNFGYYLAADPSSFPAAADTFIILLNPQSVGECTLVSSDPSVPLSFNPRFFTHPYDKRVAIEATKEFLRINASPAYAKDTIGPLLAPKSDKEEDILAFWRANAAATWHATGTVKMGRSQDEEGACVDTNFKVYGVEGLRAADMSVFILLPNSHTQSTAYLVGLMAGDKLVEEYGLDA